MMKAEDDELARSAPATLGGVMRIAQETAHGERARPPARRHVPIAVPVAVVILAGYLSDLVAHLETL